MKYIGPIKALKGQQCTCKPSDFEDALLVKFDSIYESWLTVPTEHLQWETRVIFVTDTGSTHFHDVRDFKRTKDDETLIFSFRLRPPLVICLKSAILAIIIVHNGIAKCYNVNETLKYNRASQDGRYQGQFKVTK